jgi:hypothetical protein
MVNEPQPSAASEVERLRRRAVGVVLRALGLRRGTTILNARSASLTSRLVDLGVWLDEGYVLSYEPPDDVR